MNRQRLVLAGLVAVFAASLVYAFWAMPRQQKAPPRAVAAKPAAQAKATKPTATSKGVKQPKPATDRLQLELLNREPWEFPGADRDIFRFRGGWATPVVQEAAPVVEEPPPPPPPPPPPTPAEILHGKMAGITFLGFLDKGGVRTVFLSVDGELFLVKAGQSFGKDKELIAREITAKQLVVGWTQGPETVKVQLVENQKLATIGSGTEGRGAAAGSVMAPGLRPVGSAIAPRRLLIPQRVPVQPQPDEEAAPEEPVEEAEAGDQPEENVNMEESLKQGLPSGE